MPNVNLEALIPEFWASAFDQLDIGEFGLHNLVSRNLENQLANNGDTVNVPIVPEVGDAEDWSPGSSITPTDITQQTVPVTLNKSKRKTFQLTAKEASLTPYDLIQVYGVSHAKSLMKTLNADIYAELLKSPHLIDARSTFDENKIIDAATMLSVNEIAQVGRFLVSSPEDYGSMVKLPAFLNFYQAGDAQAKNMGILGEKLGFAHMRNNGISTYTPSDVTGAVANGGGYPLGTTTMLVNGFADSVTPIRPGDIFTVAGETGSPIHTVLSTVKTAGVTTSITFSGALASSVADTAAITVIPTRSLLAFVPGAAALAIRTYASWPAGVGASSTVINWNGIPIRVTAWMTDHQNLLVQYDILYGIALINSKRVVRILR